jgi:Peptidase family S41
MMATPLLMRFMIMLMICGMIGMPALAEHRASQVSATLSAAEQDAALKAIMMAFEKEYVFPEVRPRIIERLKAEQRSGRYAVDDPVVFAERITEDLLDVSHDKHLWLSVDPAGYAAAISGATSDDGEKALWRRRAIRNHHGLTEMKILSGNVRYLRISGFEWLDDETGIAYDDAMRFLKDGDAAIIDIRGNGGGSHPAVRYLVSHFMRGDVLELSFLEGAETVTQSRTLEHLPVGRLQGMPLYVLIDLGAASAAEAFAYDVQQFKLGELVGTRTVGAANNNKLLPIAPNFMLSVSYARPVHAISNSNWEGVGVAPTVEAPAQALEIAHALALKRLSEKEGVSAENLADYAWAKIAVEASLHPVTFTRAQLQRLAGNYGSMKVAFRDGVLWLSRPDRPTARLSPLTADGLFAIERIDTLRVRFTGRAMELLRAGEPKPRVFPRG